MDNREKAQLMVDKLYPSTRKELIELLEAELNRLDAPEPKKWEPRGGDYILLSNGEISVWSAKAKNEHFSDTYRLAGREYPTIGEAQRAAPLHRKLDRLVNWLVEHCPQDIEFRTSWDSTSVRVHLHVPAPVIDEWQKDRDSGEVEL